MATETAPAEELRGLTEEEARRRLAARGKPAKPPTSRSYWTIVRGNLFTLPNIILGVLGIATLALGQTADALFLGVVVANVVIGSVSGDPREAGARPACGARTTGGARDQRRHGAHDCGRRTSWSATSSRSSRETRWSPTARSRRRREPPARRVDAHRRVGSGRKSPGDQVLSGAFAVEGIGRFEVTAVGPDSYAEQLTGQARTFRHPTSPFQRGLGRLILTLVDAQRPARAAAVDRGVAAGVVLRRGLQHGRRRRDQPHSRRPDPAREHRLRDRRAEDVPPRSAGSAAQRRRVACLRRTSSAPTRPER